MQTIWSLCSIPELGAMDSLHVSGGTGVTTTSSKTSSRSASPCRPRQRESSQGDNVQGGQNPGQNPSGTYHPHHVKTLSHGSVESAKSQDGGGGVGPAHRASRHRSPTTSSGRQPMAAAEPEEPPPAPPSADESLGASDLDSSHRVEWSFASDADDRDEFDPKTSAVLEHLGNKIVRVRDLIRTEQKLRDDNVNEYLKLAANADKQQVQRIKAVFEKKNQKSAHVISQLQKKLDVYQKKVHELEKYGAIQSHRPPREVLRDMGQGLKNVGGNIRDGITGFSGSVMSKPREFAHLIKNKFGSADNISQLSRAGATGSDGGATGVEGGPASGSDQGDKAPGRNHHHHHGSATLPAQLHATASQGSMQQHHKQKFPSDEGSECSSVTSISMEGYRPQDNARENFIEVNKKLRGIQDQLEGFSEGFENIKQLQNDIRYLSVALQEEKFKTERLEEQINDLTELHQNEVENLKQAMADMEEKVQYQSDERLRDIHEMLEHCQTKIQKMEHQALQQQQYVTLEGLDNSNARALVVKLINVLLTVLQVILLLVATGAGIIMPFLRTRVRIITTLVFVIAVVFTLKQWPEVSDIGSHVMKRLKDTLDPVQ